MAHKAHSLSHTKWTCKYHIVFISKYRRKAIYNQYRKDLGEILRLLCKYKGDRNHRRTFNAGSCTYVSRNTAKICSIQFCRIFKGKIIIDDV